MFPRLLFVLDIWRNQLSILENMRLPTIIHSISSMISNLKLMRNVKCWQCHYPLQKIARLIDSLTKQSQCVMQFLLLKKRSFSRGGTQNGLQWMKVISKNLAKIFCEELTEAIDDFGFATSCRSIKKYARNFFHSFHAFEYMHHYFILVFIQEYKTFEKSILLDSEGSLVLYLIFKGSFPFCWNV